MGTGPVVPLCSLPQQNPPESTRKGCTRGQFDPAAPGFSPNACWLFMADASQWRLLSPGHTWLLWDEVTTLTLSHTPLTPWNSCIVVLSATIGLFTNVVSTFGII